ncbi:T9SS type A sorting domain-containing protein [Gelidibacter sediminis]|uniref:T9SS type A sorting domain-containing protein n=1 Tax=Gelidibacter sediminis TaxID=1608710 RepID=UPI001415203B
MELFDIQGRLIFSSRDMNYIDVSKYLDGVNFIKITTAEGQISKRILVKRF